MNNGSEVICHAQRWRVMRSVECEASGGRAAQQIAGSASGFPLCRVLLSPLLRLSERAGDAGWASALEWDTVRRGWAECSPTALQ